VGDAYSGATIVSIRLAEPPDITGIAELEQRYTIHHDDSDQGTLGFPNTEPDWPRITTFLDALTQLAATNQLPTSGTTETAILAHGTSSHAPLGSPRNNQKTIAIHEPEEIVGMCFPHTVICAAGTARFREDASPQFRR